MNASKHNQQYPEQTGAYKVKVKNKSRWQAFNTAAFDISVGNNNQEGAKLSAAIDWAKPRFDKVVIHCNDTLQRFNIMFEDNIDEQAAEIKAKQEGNAWLARNSHALKDCTIERWDLWREHANFSPTLNHVYRLYDENAAFRSDINELIQDLWERRHASNDDQTHRRAEFNTLSREYLLEETAIFSLMNQDKTQLHIYPGTFMKIFDSFRGTNIIPGLGDLEYLHIDFSRNKNHKPEASEPQKVAANSNNFDTCRLK